MPDREPLGAGEVHTVPANQVEWDELQSVLGVSDAGRCQCQRFKVPGWIWRDSTLDGRRDAWRAQTHCGEVDSTESSGLVAFVDKEPAGWVAVEPRLAYPKLCSTRMPWLGRPEEPRDDDTVWAITCLVVRKGYRGRGLTYLLVEAATEHARRSGASAVEGYAMLTEPGKVITWGELHVGARQVFADNGFREITHPSKRRFVMRKDFR